jgi:hypothetical protein
LHYYLIAYNEISANSIPGGQMPINYIIESEKYRPAKISTLLIGEAPPPSGKVYFYVPRIMSNSILIRKDRNLAATIFNHYFGRRPDSIEEYVSFLKQLQEMGIFLIDICQESIKVRGCKEGLDRVILEISNLRNKIASRGMEIQDKDIIFLLARNNYKKQIHYEFPNSRLIRWIDFRMSVEELEY